MPTAGVPFRHSQVMLVSVRFASTTLIWTPVDFVFVGFDGPMGVVDGVDAIARLNAAIGDADVAKEKMWYWKSNATVVSAILYW